MLFLRATEHMTFSWQSSWWWKYLKILFPAMVWIHMSLISCDEGIHIQWDEGQIMKVIYFKKQPKNSKFYWLISFTKPHKSHEKERIYPIALSPNISSHDDETESSLFLSAIGRRIRLFTCCRNTSRTKFQSDLWGKRIFAIFNHCQDKLQNLDETISWPFPVNWIFNQRLTEIEVSLIYNQFFNE